MLQHWERWGFHRGKHYVIGIKPPKKLGWPDPVIPPSNWENTISFYNGSIGTIISQDRKGTSNSLSLDYLDIDEAKFIDFEQLKTRLSLPTEAMSTSLANTTITMHAHYFRYARD